MTQIVQFDYEELQIVIKNCLHDAIEEIKSLPTPEEISDRCTIPEACEITGLSKSQLYKNTMDRAIPFEKYGRKLIFSRKELEAWMSDRTVRKLPTVKMAENHLQLVAKKRAG